MRQWSMRSTAPATTMASCWSVSEQRITAPGLAAASLTFHALRRRLTLLQHAKFLPRAGSIAVLLIALAGVLPLRLVAAVSKPVVPDVATVLKSDPRSKRRCRLFPSPACHRAK